MTTTDLKRAYIRCSDARIGAGLRPLTVGTFLGQMLRGRAARYSSRYRLRLLAALATDAALIETISARGGVAYATLPRSNEGGIV